MNHQIQSFPGDFVPRNLASWLFKFALVFSLLILISVTQSYGQVKRIPKPTAARLVIPVGPTRKSDNQTLQAPTLTKTEKHFRVPSGRVKVIVHPNHLVITGTQGDVEIIKRAVATIQAKMKAGNDLDPHTSERIPLKFQTADVVALMLNNSLDSHLAGPPVKVEALHFPESILLVGPASSVKQAKKLLATIDSHSLFKKRNPLPQPKRIH